LPAEKYGDQFSNQRLTIAGFLIYNTSDTLEQYEIFP
jgi:hypothetical protein